jgi:hypothetical protein
LRVSRNALNDIAERDAALLDEQPPRRASNLSVGR